MCAVRSFWGESRTHPRCFWQKSPESVENKGWVLQKARKSPKAENTQLDAESELKIETSGFFGIFEYSDMILQTYVVVASPSIVGDMNKRPLSKSEARILQ
jgi:hypothetical protein